MASNTLSIGKSALAAAQVGISVTGHNIANASTPGFSRQVMVQGTAAAQDFGYGFLGQGTQITAIQRIYNETLSKHVNNSQATSSEINAYATQMTQIDNLLANPSAGVAPAIQEFFNTLQAASSNPGDAASRQTLLSAAQSLASRFRGVGDRLNEIGQDVNTQLGASVGLVNSYAKQIAQLNDAIESATGATSTAPNDLLDQRDQLINDLSKQLKVSVVKQDGVKYSVFVGNGLPLVLGNDTFSLTTARSPTDSSRLEVAYNNKGKSTILGSSSLAGGTIGGLIQFREQSLDSAQSKLGLVGLALSETFNQQHEQALDSAGKAGGQFFTVTAPLVNASTLNTGTAVVTADISDAKALTGSNYRLQYDGSNYKISKLSDNTSQSFATLPQAIDGISFNITSGAMASGDDFLVKPTALGATGFAVAISDISKMALGGPALTNAAATTNTGTGSISAAKLSAGYAASPLATPFTVTYSGGNLTGFPAAPVTVTNGAASTTYPASTPVPFTSGATYSVSGLSFTMGGTPNNTDKFNITPNTSTGKSDNRNALLLAALQTSATTLGGTASYEGAYGQLVSQIGSKTSELKVTGKAETELLAQAVASQQSESGVNLDEEATNLLRYQQAYQAAGKMMQIASQMFDTLLTLGG
ncbi:MAG: flagellar hook-associated protein FlgK [Methylophilaceae bacterium]|nr:flagellar hook-associated protein FlgK [Methylophilaceae bacterium]